ncbi:MAG: adenylyltransferase/cytidyltransferase family protein [bacterium]
MTWCPGNVVILNCLPQAESTGKRYFMISTGKKILSRPAGVAFRKKAAGAGKTVVFTNGCFDIIHPGHVALLEAAGNMGDLLMVGLNSDASVKRLKGKGRPVNVQKDRARVLAALEAVNAVVLFGEDTPYALLKSLRPDVLVKGADYSRRGIVGRKFTGKTVRVKLVPGKSTTGVIRRLRSRQ